MSRRSKLDPYKDQIVEWVRQGKDTRAIQALLKERNLEASHQLIGIYIKKLMAPALAKVAKAANVQLETFEQVAIEALSKYATLCAKDEAEMTIGERNYFRTLGEWFDRIARLRGLYAPQNVTQVAVQVNQPSKADWIREFVESLPDALRTQLWSFLSQ